MRGTDKPCFWLWLCLFSIIHGLIPNDRATNDTLYNDHVSTVTSLTNITSLTSPNAQTNTISLSEPQPTNFATAFQWKRVGITLYSIDVLFLLISTLCALALRSSFDQSLPTFTHTNPLSQPPLTLRFSSSRERGSDGYRVKTMMWTLRNLAWHFHQAERYAEVGFTSRFRRDGDSEPLLGFGQLVAAPATSSLIEVEAGVASGDARWDSNKRDESLLSLSSSSFNSNHEIKVGDFKCVRDGPVWAPADIYQILINLLIGQAEKPLTEPIVSLGSYSARVNCSVQIGATSMASAYRLTNRIVVWALLDLARKLPTVDTVFRWRQCTFLIRDDGRIVGRGVLAEGRPDSGETAQVGR